MSDWRHSLTSCTRSLIIDPARTLHGASLCFNYNYFPTLHSRRQCQMLVTQSRRCSVAHLLTCRTLQTYLCSHLHHTKQLIVVYFSYLDVSRHKSMFRLSSTHNTVIILLSKSLLVFNNSFLSINYIQINFFLLSKILVLLEFLLYCWLYYRS